MRSIIYLLALALFVSCGPALPQPVGGRDVAVQVMGCNEPQSTWVAEEVKIFGWHVAEHGEVIVRCDEAQNGALGEYILDQDYVIVDPTRAVGEFQFKQTTGHELWHWLVYHGPHPDRARYHVCTWAYNESAPPLCFPYRAERNAMMSPGAQTPWDGDVETFYILDVPQNVPTEADILYLNWALEP